MIGSGLTNRDFDRGRRICSAVACKSCGNIDPDLTALGTHFLTRDILEAIIAPNEAISDQYAAPIFTMKDGRPSVVGRLVGEDQAFPLAQNPFPPGCHQANSQGGSRFHPLFPGVHHDSGVD